MVVGGPNLSPFGPDMQHSSCTSFEFAASSFVDPATVWSAGGCYGGPPRLYVQVTTDGGDSWHQVNLPPVPPTTRCPFVTSATLPIFTSPHDRTVVVRVQHILPNC